MNKRGFVIYFTVFLQLLMLICFFFLAKLYIADSDSYDLEPQGLALPADTYISSRLSSRLHILDGKRLERKLANVAEVSSYIMAFTSKEELEEGELEYKTEFLLRQKQIIEKQKERQAELDRKALQAITDSGGKSVATGSVVQINEDDLATKPELEEEFIDLGPGYTYRPPTVETLGTFNVEFICTCIDCLDATKYPNLAVGDDCVIIDSDIIVPGEKLSFSALSGVYISRDDGTAPDKFSAIVCCSNHELVVGKTATESIVYHELN